MKSCVLRKASTKVVIVQRRVYAVPRGVSEANEQT
jgi:hypothetical protein